MSSPLNSEPFHSEEIPLEEVHIIERTSKSLKHEHFEKPDRIERICITEVPNPPRGNNKALDPLACETEVVEKIEKIRVQKINKPRFDFTNAGKSFAPFICNSFKVPANTGFNYGANMYNAKNNMIICCPSNSTVHFYASDDLTPIKQCRRKQLSSSVVQMSYCEETDTYLMGCAFGDIYIYNATLHKLQKVLKESDSFILAITYLDENNFAFSSAKSGKLSFGNIESETTVQKCSGESDIWYLHHIPIENILFAGFANGKIAIYKSKGSYRMLGSLQAHQFGKYVTMIISVSIKGKEYIVTGGNDKKIKIWQSTKGRMRLLKVMQANDCISTLVYLENYQMIVSTHHKDYLSFFKLPHGKLETTLNLEMEKIRNVFLMKDKNTIGVTNLTKNTVKIVQLHPSESFPEIEIAIEEDSHKDHVVL